MIQPEKEWRAHLADGRFMIQRAPGGQHVFYPRVMAPGSGERDLEWAEASGDGIVHAVTIVRHKDPAENYNVVLVDLVEGPRLMTRIDGIAHEAITIGMPVRARIVDEDGAPLLVFSPA